MTTQPQDVYDLLMKIRYDATAIQAKVTDALAALNDLGLEARIGATCTHCGLDFRGPNTLAEHIHISHDGPVPQHWLDTETRSLDPVLDARAQTQTEGCVS